MEVCSVSEILYLPAVAAAVRLVSHVHRTMHVADEVHEEFKRKCLLLLVQVAALERFDQLFHKKKLAEVVRRFDSDNAANGRIALDVDPA